MISIDEIIALPKEGIEKIVYTLPFRDLAAYLEIAKQKKFGDSRDGGVAIFLAVVQKRIQEGDCFIPIVR